MSKSVVSRNMWRTLSAMMQNDYACCTEAIVRVHAVLIYSVVTNVLYVFIASADRQEKDVLERDWCQGT